MNIALTKADILKWIAYGPTVLQAIHGMNNQGTPLYIQFHEVPPATTGPLTLAAGAVPAYKSLQVAANSPFWFALNSTLGSCLYVVSTTELNYTAAGANGGLDATLECGSDFLCDGTEVVVGDLTTANNSAFTVFADSTTPKKLLRLDVVELLAAVRFFGVGTGATNATVDSSYVGKLPASATVTRLYGTDSFFPPRLTTGFTQQNGCYVYVYNSVPIAGVDYAPVPFSTGAVTNSSFACRGVYR